MPRNTNKTTTLLATMLLLLTTPSSYCSVLADLENRCEEITIPMCLGIGYNHTRMPNELNHETQEEAGLEVHQFWPLVEIRCSPDLKFFLCSMYAPICLEDFPKPLPPCRGLCSRARLGCEPIMTQYGFKWPERMECEHFPVQGGEILCMDQPARNGTTSTTTLKPNISRKKPGKAVPACRGAKNCSETARPLCKCQCRAPLVARPGVRVGAVPDCAHPCKETYFNPDEKEFADVWISLWSGLCAASTLMTLTTFLIETERFKYPERPIVFLSACYFLVSVGYLIRVGMGHEAVACDGTAVRYTSTGPNTCTAVFLLVYFFGMASSIWWVVLSLTWFLAAGLKWGNEAIAGYSQYFHVAAWLVPTFQTVAVLITGSVDGDPVVGICYVGNMNMDNLKTFVLIPLIVYLIVGTTFLMAGFVSLFRIRNVIKKQGGTKADKLEKLMIRIGIFSVLYTVPATIVIACHLYETAFHDEWMGNLSCDCPFAHDRPIYSVLMLKYFMALAVGITSGVWIWSGKTVDSWRRLSRRVVGKPDATGAEAVLLAKHRGKPPPPGFLTAGGGGSLMGGGASSASQHHLHPHVMKQAPLGHV